MPRRPPPRLPEPPRWPGPPRHLGCTPAGAPFPLACAPCRPLNSIELAWRHRAHRRRRQRK
eukprot:9473673-Pyramimonas_sp.AAC.1